MATPYSLDGAIASFFESNATATRQQCDDCTLSHMSGPINPVQIQGTFSYTLTVGSNASKLFQFRMQNLNLDIGMMNLAKAVHPQLMASCNIMEPLANLDRSTSTRWTKSLGPVTLWRVIRPPYSHQTLCSDSTTP